MKRSPVALTVAARTAAELDAANRRFYDALWSDARMVEAERFNTWELVRGLALSSRRSLEVGPGLRPRLPLAGTCFIDLSAAALSRLRRRGAAVAHGTIHSLPFPDGTFDLVAALDIIEHVDDDERALCELSRVAAPGAVLLLSTPLHPDRFTAFDDMVGHRRRYEPRRLRAMLAARGFQVESSAVFGMKPQSSRWRDFGMWFLVRHRARAMWWYNRVIMPIGIYFQEKLAWCSGMIDTAGVDEVLLICRRERSDGSSR